MPGLVRPTTDERDNLLGYLAQERYVLTLTAHGLTDEQIGMAPTASPLSVGGIIKHVTAVERGWTGLVTGTPRQERDYEGGFRVDPDQTLSSLLEDYAAAARATDDVVGGVADLDQPVPVPPGVPWFPDDVAAWSVRWVVLHLITETARHAGHADLVRESIDGATAFPLLAAAEGWPETSWMKPWAPGEP